MAIDTALLGGAAGVFAPIFKLSAPIFDLVHSALAPFAAMANRSSGELRLEGGGGVDVWSLEHERAGRGRRYNIALIDEAAYGDDNLTRIWRASILPTLVDLRGAAIVASTPNGIDEANFFWRVCNEAGFGFVEHWAPSSANPFLPADELERLQREHNPLVFAQEFEAQFVDLSGVSLFNVRTMIGVDEPERYDTVFAVIDSGMKGGVEHDASAAVYFGLDSYSSPPALYVLDWEAVELTAGSLEPWFVSVSERLYGYVKAGRTRGAVPHGILVERAAMGEMLLDKASALGVVANEVNSKFVARGKDLRALAAERFVNGGAVRLTRSAVDKVSRLKGVERNHLMAQIAGFRIGDKDAWRRADDLLDAFVYGVLQAFSGDE